MSPFILVAILFSFDMIRKLIVIYFLFIAPAIMAQPANSIIPEPISFISKEGSFILHRKIAIVEGPVWITGDAAARTFCNTIKQQLGLHLAIVQAMREGTFENAINLKKINDRSLGNEGYKLEVKANGIVIQANTDTGLFYALQTLLQLVPEDFILNSNPKAKIPIPCCVITDQPQFTYRGMHLDVSRHFFTVEEIKKYLDLMAFYKFNTFHWHLTDDQGWRIEIKKYPKLTETGSIRKETIIGNGKDNQYDGKSYGGFYTQNEIKEVVAYAATKCITVIPEIEMPGHAMAALSAYPQLSCSGGPFNVATRWGVFDDVFCTKDETFSFLQDVLSEVCSLFPSSFIHIGGDECPKKRWKECNICQQRIATEGLNNENELQAWFVKKIERMLLDKGKKMIGWDEILDGGINSTATIMSWRGYTGGILAARKSHAVIMTPNSHCYFDYYQGNPDHEPLAIGGFLPLEKVYSFNPLPEDSLNDTEKKFILGAQANLWTEYISDFNHLTYMAYPRAMALSEVLWTGKNRKSYVAFCNRLVDHLQRFEKQQVSYAKQVFDITFSTSNENTPEMTKVELKKSVSRGDIKFTLDGTNPDSKSKSYTSPITLKNGQTLKAVYFNNGIKGNVSVFKSDKQ
jgi:hexosaminidase